MSTQAVIVHSGKMLKSGLKVKYTMGDTKQKKRKGQQEYPDAIPHKHLVTAQQATRIHFAILGGEITDADIVVKTIKGKKVPSFKDKELQEKFRVTGITIVEKSDEIILSGQVHTKLINWKGYNAKINPNVAADDDESNDNDDEVGKYPYIDHLQEMVNRTMLEYALLITEDKQGDDPQQSLKFGEETDGNTPPE